MEYEISVGPVFCSEGEKLEKWDCYQQAKDNIPMIAREVIRQYRSCLKQNKGKRDLEETENIKNAH